MGIEMTGFDALLRRFQVSGDALSRQTELKVRRWAERLAGAARAGCPVNTGETRNSIRSYVDRRGGEIEGGARSDNPVAVYQEFGTGPVGEASGHPAQAELGIAHRPDGWTYQSAAVAATRGEEFVSGEKGGYVYTEGVPARAFMYNAMVSLEDEIVADLGGTVEEVLT